jgi:hypothetical protein
VPEQIIIEFIGDASKLAPAVDVLEQLGQIDAKAAQSFRASNAELAKRETILKKTNAEEQKQVKTINDVGKSVAKLGSTFKQAFEAEIMTAIDEAGISIEEFEAALKKNGITLDSYIKSQIDLKGQLKQTVNAMTILKANNEDVSVQYEELKEKAGGLKKAINDVNKEVKESGSDTKGLSKLIELTRGIAGGYAVLSAGAAIFGDENKNVEETIAQVNSAMAVMQGLQEIGIILNKTEYQSLGAIVGLQRVQVIQTNLQTAAESKSVIVRWLAVAAQRALNVAMSANPIGILIVGIAAVAAGLALFGTNARESARAQAELNSTLKDLGEYLDEDLKRIENFNAKMVAFGLVRGEGYNFFIKKEEELYNAELVRIQESINNANKLLDDEKKINKLSEEDFKKLLESKQKAEEKKQAIIDKADIRKYEIQREQYERDIKSFTAYQDAKVFIARKGSIAELEAQINASKARRDAELNLNPDLTPGERAKIIAQTNREILELDNAITVKRLQNIKFLKDAALLNAKAGSIAELQIKKDAVIASRNVELAALGISTEQQKAIRASSAREIKEIDAQLQQRRIQLQIDSNDALLSKAKEGSKEQFKFSIEALKLQYEYDLKELGITANKKTAIEEKYLKSVRDLTKQFNKQTAEDTVNTKLSDTNTKLAALQKASTSATNAEVLGLKKQAIDEQVQLEIISAEFSIHNEQAKQAKLKEIIAKANAEKLALEEAQKIAIINNSLETTQLEIALEQNKQIKILNTGGFGFKKRIEARKEIKRLEIEAIKAEENANEEKFKKQLITLEEYEKKKLEISKKYSDKDLENTIEKEDLKKQIKEASIKLAQDISNAYFEVEQAQIQARLDSELKRIDEQKSKELENANLTEQQKADINAKYREKERAIRRKAAEDEKQAKITQALINGALAITNILATMPKFDFGVASALAIGASIVSTGIAVAKIKSTPIPAFKTGTKNAPSGYALVGEEGPEIVKLNGGEKIYKYKDSMRIADAWRGGLAANADEILTMGGRLPIFNNEAVSNTYVDKSGSLSIDYTKLGKAIVSQLPKPVINNIIMDENGFSKYIIDNGNKTTIKNERYTF